MTVYSKIVGFIQLEGNYMMRRKMLSFWSGLVNDIIQQIIVVSYEVMIVYSKTVCLSLRVTKKKEKHVSRIKFVEVK